jgi:putative endonuclease
MRLQIFKGKHAETQASRHLQSRGLKLLATNYRCKRGEIDLIMQDADTLVFVEVRYRQSDRYGSALETVTQGKQNRLIAAASHYLQQQGHNSPCRFDVVGISGPHGATIEWIKDAFEAG